MPDPVSFTSTTPRFALPFLFSGQSQKELTVNQAHALIDALLHPAVEGTANEPPASAEDGECWLLDDAPVGVWADRAGQIACRQAGVWLFLSPRDGLQVLDKSTGQAIRFREGWQRPSAPTLPAAGATIDAEARAAIAGLVEALIASGILPES